MVKMNKDIVLQRLVFLDENVLNPLCHHCHNELSAFLITEEQLIQNFSEIDLGYLLQKKLIQKSKTYSPQLIIFLCKTCCKGEKT